MLGRARSSADALSFPSRTMDPLMSVAHMLWTGYSVHWVRGKVIQVGSLLYNHHIGYEAGGNGWKEEDVTTSKKMWSLFCESGKNWKISTFFRRETSTLLLLDNYCVWVAVAGENTCSHTHTHRHTNTHTPTVWWFPGWALRRNHVFVEALTYLNSIQIYTLVDCKMSFFFSSPAPLTACQPGFTGHGNYRCVWGE